MRLTLAMATGALLGVLLGCDGPEPGIDGGMDAGGRDGGARLDAGAVDAGAPRDAGDGADAGGPLDSGPPRDAGVGTERSAVEFDRNSTNVDGEDEITIVCDDATPGAGGHQPCDVGAGSFTFEVWLRGEASENNNTSSIGPDEERASYDWIEGNIFLDRDVFGGSCDGRDFGASVIDGRVSFGIGQTPNGGPLTLYGSTPVVESPAVWHHVALVYDDASNRLGVFVDGALDAESTTAIGDSDRSIPDTGCSMGSARSPGRQVELSIGCEKHGFGAISFDGRIARVRIWDVARTAAEIGGSFDRVVPCSAAGLVARYDLEEGAGAVGAETCGRSPDAIVSLGSRGLSRWVADGPTLSP